jgi:hypothetical protein
MLVYRLLKFNFVDKRFEISNLSLMKDITDLIKLTEDFF